MLLICSLECYLLCFPELNMKVFIDVLTWGLNPPAIGILSIRIEYCFVLQASLIRAPDKLEICDKL